MFVCFVRDLALVGFKIFISGEPVFLQFDLHFLSVLVQLCLCQRSYAPLHRGRFIWGGSLHCCFGFFSLRKCIQVCFGNSSLNEVLYRRFIVFVFILMLSTILLINDSSSVFSISSCSQHWELLWSTWGLVCLVRQIVCD